MRTQRLARIGGAGVLVLFLGLTAPRTNGDEAESDPPPRKPGRVAEEAVDVPKLMQRKLDSSQRILRGLVKGDMKDVRGGADVLSAVARSRSWAARDDAVFEHFNVEFQRLAGKLGRMAEQRNLEGAAYVYNQLTSTCISCHEHVRDVKRVPTIVPLSSQPDSE